MCVIVLICFIDVTIERKKKFSSQTRKYAF